MGSWGEARPEAASVPPRGRGVKQKSRGLPERAQDRDQGDRQDEPEEQVPAPGDNRDARQDGERLDADVEGPRTVLAPDDEDVDCCQ